MSKPIFFLIMQSKQHAILYETISYFFCIPKTLIVDRVSPYMSLITPLILEILTLKPVCS